MHTKFNLIYYIYFWFIYVIVPLLCIFGSYTLLYRTFYRIYLTQLNFIHTYTYIYQLSFVFSSNEKKRKEIQKEIEIKKVHFATFPYITSMIFVLTEEKSNRGKEIFGWIWYALFASHRWFWCNMDGHSNLESKHEGSLAASIGLYSAINLLASRA